METMEDTRDNDIPVLFTINESNDSVLYHEACATSFHVEKGVEKLPLSFSETVQEEENNLLLKTALVFFITQKIGQQSKTIKHCRILTLNKRTAQKRSMILRL